MVATRRFLKDGFIRYPPFGIGYDIPQNFTRSWCTLPIPPFVFRRPRVVFQPNALERFHDHVTYLCVSSAAYFTSLVWGVKQYTVLSYLFNQFNPKSEQNYYKSLFTFFLLSDARRGNLSTVIPLVSLRRGSVVNMLKHFSKYVKAVQKLR